MASSDFTVDKAQITASFDVVAGHVLEIRLPDYIANDGRPIYLGPAALEGVHERMLLLMNARGRS